MKPHLFTKAYFESGTISSYSGYKDAIPFRLIAKEIISFFSPTSVLEAGCAKGYVIKHLRSLGVDAMGIDISEYAIHHADVKVRSFVQVAQVQKLPFDDNRFDLVFSLDLLEHIPENEVDQAIEELLRVGDIQLHFITTKELDPGKDLTHITLRPMSWWKEKFAAVKKKPQNTCRKQIFLVASECHWIHDLLRDNNKKSLQYKRFKQQLRHLKKENKAIYHSRGWRFAMLVHRLRVNLPFLKEA